MVNVMLEYPGGYLELVPAGEFTFPDDRTGVMKTVVVDRHVKVCERYGRVKVTPGAVAFIGREFEKEGSILRDWCCYSSP